MTDIAQLGIQLDSGPVETARQRLRDFKTEAAGSSAAVQQLTNMVSQLVRAQNETNTLLKSHADNLRGATQQTNSFTDSIARLAVAAGAATVVYKGMSSAINLASDGMREQLTMTQRLGDAFASLAKYGNSAFQLMGDGAIKVQRDLSLIGTQLGTTGSQVANFMQTVAPLGGSPGANSAAMSSFHHIFSGTDASALAGRSTLASLGVTGGTEDQAFRQFVSMMQQMQPGDQRNAIGNQILSPEGARLLDDTISKLHDLTTLQQRVNSLNESNADIERGAAEKRRQADEAWDAWASRVPIMTFDSKTAGDNFRANRTRAYEQIMGRDPNASRLQGVGNLFRSFGSYITGGDELGGDNAGYQVAQPGFVKNNALDSRPPAPITPIDLTEGFGDLASAGLTGPSQLNSMTAVVAKLNEDLKAGKVGLDDYNLAMLRLGYTAQQVVDPLMQLRSQVAAARAGASAATGGSYAATTAQIAAEERANFGRPQGQIDESISLRTGLLDAQMQRTRNEQMFSIWDQSSAANSQTRALISGQGGAAALLAGAHSRARRLLPQLYSDEDNTELDTTDPYVQSLIREQGIGVQDNAGSMIRRLTAQIGQIQKQTAAERSGNPDSFGAVSGIRQFTGIDVLTKQLRDFAEATDDSNEKGKQAKQIYLDEASQLDKLATSLEKARQAQRAAAVEHRVNEQIGLVNTQANDIASGMSPYQMLLDQNTAKLTKEYQGTGVSSDTIATQAKTLTDSDERLKRLIETEKTWNGTINTSLDALGQGLKKAIEDPKNFKQIGIEVIQKIDDALLEALVAQPFENLAKNLIGLNSTNTSMFSFASPGQGNALGLIGSLFGAGSGDAATSSAAAMAAGSGAGGAAAEAGATSSIGEWIASFFHDGGMVGSGGRYAFANPALFRGAPRYHTGLMPDEQPAILQKGERVLSREEVARGVGGERGGMSVHVHGPLMNIVTPDVHGFRKTKGQAAAETYSTLQRLGSRNS